MGGNGSVMKGIRKHTNVYYDHDLEEEETKDEKLKNTGLFKTEKQKLWYGESTDIIERGILYSNFHHLKNINKRLEKSYNFSFLDMFNVNINSPYKNKKYISFHAREQESLAYYSPAKGAIVYDTTRATTIKQLKSIIKQNVDRKWFVNIPEKNYINYIISHEYGHHLFGKIAENRLIKNKAEISNRNYKKELTKIKNEIIKIRDKTYKKRRNKLNTFISRYGEKTNGEWLAEVFTSLVNNKTNKNNEFLYSMHKWLKENKGE